jgi:RNA polymerase sigma-70 factor (ECF subfamily)
MVLGLCRLLLRDPVEAEDAAQQVFLSAHQAILRGSPPRDQAAWMAAIARNECRGRIRARMREPLALPELPSDLPDPLAAAIRAADLKAVWLALGELPRRQRNALVLRELGGLSYHELGRALGVSHSAIESLLFRARERVRSLVAGSNAASLGIALRELLVRVFPDQSAVAWKLAGAAVGVGVVATGAGSLHPHVAVRPHVVVPAVVQQLHPAVTPAPAREHVVAPARPPATPPRDPTPAHISRRDEPVRPTERAEQAAVRTEPAEDSEPADPSTPEEEPAEPAQLDEPDVEWDSGSDQSGDSERESDDGSDHSGPG